MSTTKFRKKVYNIVKTIEAGHTMTYAEVAKLIGNPRAARAVGNVLKKNYDPSIPCHRVIRADGCIGEYNRGAETKIRLLKKEGVIL
jgi:methylated-DNA-[protein]-cysteine S-methyltransferase